MTTRTGLSALLLLILSSATASAVGCGSSSRGSDFVDSPAADAGGEAGKGFGGNEEALTLDPPNAILFIDTAQTPPAPATQAYTVKLKAGGAESDLTEKATFTLSDEVGTFVKNMFTSKTELPDGVPGMTTIVHAESGEYKGTAQLTVVALRQSGDNRDFFFLEPHNQPCSPTNDVLKFGTNIQKVDVAFLMDTTGSMGGSIMALQGDLSSKIVPALTAVIPSVEMAVVDHKDYPVSPYGSTFPPIDFPVRVYQTMTPTVSAVKSAINLYAASGGADGPESQIPAMQHILTGEELTWPGGNIPKHTPAAMRWGGVDFRNGSVPVIVLMTDIDWHGLGHDPYSFTTAPSMSNLMAGFIATNARFVSITSFNEEGQPNELSDVTSSNVPPSAFGVLGVDRPASCQIVQCCTDINGAGRINSSPSGNCRLNFRHQGGTGVSTAIAKAIQAIAIGTQFDINAKVSNDPNNPNGVDAVTAFMKGLRAMDEGDATQGCPAQTALDTDGDGVKDTFKAVRVGTPVCFEVIPKDNTTVPPEVLVQFYNATIDILGQPGNVQLDQRIVRFLVPPGDRIK